MERKEFEENPIEAKQRTTTLAQLNLTGYLDARPEIGLARMLRNVALEPQEPFKPDAHRTLRKGFVIAGFFSAAFVVWFVFFNVIR